MRRDMETPLKVMGLMSGTSLDGIDAALVTLSSDRSGGLRWSLDAYLCERYTEARRKRIQQDIERGDVAAICRLHAEMGEWFAGTALELCRQAAVLPTQVDLIGSHGQTVWHIPPSEDSRGATLQLGDPATIAERTGIPVVSDFRARDLAAHGEGAPLVAAADQLMFVAGEGGQALQNLGGMANVTWLPPAGSAERLIAFDTGPGVALMDAAVMRATAGARQFDIGGAMAARGEVDEALAEQLLAHEFFLKPPPKTTGREVFGTELIDRLIRDKRREGTVSWEDLVATLTEVTARSIGRAYREWVIPMGVDHVYLFGGGARNPMLVAAIVRELDGLNVQDGWALGLDPDAREAVAFAVLAWAHVRRHPGNVPSATGADGPRVLGSFTPGSSDRTEIE